MTITLHDPIGRAVWQETFSADEDGDFSYQARSDAHDQLVLTGEATAGVYALSRNVNG